SGRPDGLRYAHRAGDHGERREKTSFHASTLPRVSGIQIQSTAAAMNAAEHTSSAAPKPCVSASEPTRYGAAALARRPTLYVNPCAVARTAVGYTSAVTAPKPLKYPVAVNAT